MPIDQRLLTEFYQLGMRHGREGKPASIANGTRLELWAMYGAGFKAGRNHQLWKAVFEGSACLITDRNEGCTKCATTCS